MNARLSWAIHKMRFTLPKTHWRSRHAGALSNIRCRTGQKPKRGSAAGEMGQGQAGKESALKETRPRIQSAPLSLIHPQTENRYRQPAVTPSHPSDSSQHNSTKG